MTRELLHAIGSPASYYLTKLNCIFVQLLVLIPFYTLGSNPRDRELVYTNDSSFFPFRYMSHCKQELVRLHRHSMGSLLETQDSDVTFRLLFANCVFNR